MPFLDFNSGSANSDMEQAIAALQGVGVPSIAQLTLPQLQKYVSAGVLTPQQYQAIQADPQSYQQIANQADQSGVTAQKAALQQLGGIVNAGGSTPINQANLLNNINQTNQAMQANRAGIQENAQERGVSGGGLEFINQLMNNQAGSQQANTGAINAASNNAQLALQALANQGNLGGNVQSQSNQMAQAKAQAAQQIAQYNSQLQSTANQYNTQNANAAQAANLANAQGLSNQNTSDINQRTMYNAQLPQTQFNDQMQKANAVAGAYGNQAKLNQAQNQGDMDFTGKLLGTAGTLAGAYFGGPAGAAAGSELGGMASGNYQPNTNAAGYNQNTQNIGNETNWQGTNYAQGGEVNYNQGGMCYAEGGEVHDHSICMKVGGQVPGEAKVAGDSLKNDTVDAKLSPHEIVLPRSVSQAPNAPQAASQFVAQTKGMPPTAGPNVGSFADALKILAENGLELRLSVGGH